MIIPFLVELLIAIALNVISYLLQPRVKKDKPAAAQDIETPTADYDTPIRLVCGGNIIIKSPQILWFGDKGTRSFEVKA